MKNARHIAWIAGLFCAGALASSLAEEWYTETLDRVQTNQGLLQIDQVGQDGYRVNLGGHIVAELEGYHVSISSAVPSGPLSRYVLVKINKGGGSCPQLYRL